MTTNDTVYTSLACAGRVQRYHTWPTINKQTVMDHTGNVIRIYWQLFGEVPPQVCQYLIFHDLSEIKTGDAPHPIKLRNPDLKEIYDRLEDEHLEEVVGEGWASEILGSVTDYERVRMKVCDLLEMGEFAAIEQAMGNRLAEPITMNVLAALSSIVVTPEDQTAVANFIQHNILRFK